MSLMHGLETLAGQRMMAVLSSNKASNILGTIDTNCYISWLHEHISDVGDIRDLRVQEFRPRISVTCVRGTATAVAGLRLLAQLGQRSLGIVDAQNRLISSLNVGDLRVVKPTLERFSRLFDSCLSFREQSEQESVMQQQLTATLRTTASKTATVTEEDTFERVVELMAVGGASKVFVVDDAGKMNILDIIRQSDILDLLLTQLRALRGF